MASEFWDDFKRFFFRGLAAVLPTLLTVMIIVYIFSFVEDMLGAGIVRVMVFARPHGSLQESMTYWQKWWDDRLYLKAGSFVIAIVGVYFIGRFFASFIGRYAWRLVEQALCRTPVIKQIYPNIKQVTDFFLSERKFEFSRVVAVEYPRKGVWSLGLVTGSGLRTLKDALHSNMLTIFVPSSPTPVTGYTITVRRDEVIDLPMTIDEALRFTVSAGVVSPTAQQIPPAPSPSGPALETDHPAANNGPASEGQGPQETQP